jgi:hypothetical protein
MIGLEAVAFAFAFVEGAAFLSRAAETFLTVAAGLA